MTIGICLSSFSNNYRSWTKVTEISKCWFLKEKKKKKEFLPFPVSNIFLCNEIKPIIFVLPSSRDVDLKTDLFFLTAYDASISMNNFLSLIFDFFTV